MENMRQFLNRFDVHRMAVQFGSHMIHLGTQYIHTGEGIALSSFAFIQLMKKFFDKSGCNQDARTHNDDVELGKCLKSVFGIQKLLINYYFLQANVSFGNQVDENGRWRFMATHLMNVYEGNSEGNWYHSNGVKSLATVKYQFFLK